MCCLCNKPMLPEGKDSLNRPVYNGYRVCNWCVRPFHLSSTEKRCCIQPAHAIYSSYMNLCSVKCQTVYKKLYFFFTILTFLQEYVESVGGSCDELADGPAESPTPIIDDSGEKKFTPPKRIIGESVSRYVHCFILNLLECAASATESSQVLIFSDSALC